MTAWGRLWWRLRGAPPEVPAEFAGVLDPAERVVAVGELAGGDHLVLTQLGLWVPAGTGARRIGWHLVSKAIWDRNALVVTEAISAGTLGAAALLSDLPPRRFVLAQPGTVPAVVRERVTGTIRSSQRCELPGGGAWFVRRQVPGRDGVVLQVRADPGTSAESVQWVANEIAQRLPSSSQPG